LLFAIAIWFPQISEQTLRLLPSADNFAKEQPFCRLLASRDLGELACANPPELDAALKTATQQKPM
jgi:hypothetical protein